MRGSSFPLKHYMLRVDYFALVLIIHSRNCCSPFPIDQQAVKLFPHGCCSQDRCFCKGTRCSTAVTVLWMKET